MLDPTEIRIELMARNEGRSDPAGNRLELLVADQSPNVVLRAPELSGNLADCQRFGPLHAPSMDLAHAGSDQTPFSCTSFPSA